jgi:hypothetical protein
LSSGITRAGVTIAALLVCGSAAAQSGVPCTAIVNDAERLACYDRALRPAPPATSERPAEAAPGAARRANPVPGNSSAGAPAAPAAAAAPPARATVPAPAPANARAAPAVRSVVIAEVRAPPGRSTVFTTAGGEIWIQTDNQRPRFPDTPFDAQIKPGAMGSFFLVPTDRGRAMRVRRAE